MNIAIIFAGGVGQRMNNHTRPKQFLELHSKPILVYTIEQFQKHGEIDAIVVVCVKEWIDYCQQLVSKCALTKVSAIIPGGETGQQSIFNGLVKAEELFGNNSALVLIHDGVRPLIDADTITKNIICVKEHGSAITVSPSIETITVKAKNGLVGDILDRKQCQMAKAPQCFWLKDILKAHHQAQKDNLPDFIDSASIMRHYGYPLYTVEGPHINIKITTPTDYYIFKALVDAEENSQIFGF